MQKEAPPSHKLQDHAFEQQNHFELKEDNPSQRIRISSKKNDSDCSFYNFSLLVSYPNKFFVCLVARGFQISNLFGIFCIGET